jgi:acetyl-CoA carboxylase biotin carboxyl carrier protein
MSWTAADEPALDQVREHAVLLARQFPAPPRTLRVRAGDAVVELEWDTAPTGTEPADPVIARPCGYLCAGAAGVFRRAPSPGAAPFVGEGDQVAVGQQVGLIESTTRRVPVEAELAGRLMAVLKQDCDVVQDGDRLFALGSTAMA